MKITLVNVSLVSALTFGGAAVAQFIGLVTFPGTSTLALFGSLVGSGLIAFACDDYARKPSFRGRTSVTHPEPAKPVATQPALGAACDWTYSTRSA